ncbi:MAG: nitrilase-related carbon-nitrogen hydrolase [Planctomycetota bacterium]|nr:nitrilase-related carbon-nitrogen hydrolase [Planctomycetota bacterium]
MTNEKWSLLRGRPAVKVGFIQTSPILGKTRQNVASAIRRARRVRADLLVFPELFNTGYLLGSRMRALALAEPLSHSPTLESLAAYSRETGTRVVAGIAEREDRPVEESPPRACRRNRARTLTHGTRSRRTGWDDANAFPRVYNSAVLVGPEGLIGVYRKIHLFMREKDWFDAGEARLRVFDIGIAKIGLMICFDWLFPEAARTLALAGADIICHPSNLVLPFCQDAMITRSIENRVFTITANRIGTERRRSMVCTFTGGSQLTDPSGRRILAASVDAECAAVAEIDPRAARDKQITPRNSVFADRRPATYDLRNREPSS